ncbi:VTT domain-containing protein [Bradyrhizobium sp. CB3481]|uniref:VTT domain-containing protein n=1 Tax=Bradyrhizobium sp. CB3481 TaxID=3039158 RepID=UPI0024B03BF1|nr:VTT domain-containing protein [Bradyrhizobium sp. CB3481]WFU15362.1 VTT domain-containing protein [Bradyrhizobium sp. CB3481]
MPAICFFVLPRCRLLQSSSILIPGKTVWRRCKAGRLAILNDAAAYFAALREALLLARRQVYIIGWDIHSQTRFVGPSGQGEDGYPEELGAFLKALLLAKPELRINILIWNFPALYAAEREWNSATKFTAGASERLRFCFDSSLPLGSAQHQKIVVIDGALAFVGGLDLTIRRWDTSAHEVHDPLRIDPDGKPYPPFHDVQCMVDGDAAASITQIAESRWRAAGCTVETSAAVTDERWPASVPVQCRGMTAGIARTEIATASTPGVNEVALLFEASINAADRFIYIENQFTSATDIARLLARRMVEVPQLRVLIVTPKLHSSWFESQAMQSGRGGFIGQFVAAGVMDRVRFLYPAVRDDEADAAVMVHSKVMIVDDRILRVGSANLNNRSMGADTECDLAFEATSETQQKFIARLRRQLIGHFCGVGEREIESNEADLFGYLDPRAEGEAAKALRPIDPAATAGGMAAMVQPVADPREPLHLDRAATRMWTPRTILAVGGLAAALGGLALAWQYTSLHDFTDIGFVSSVISQPARTQFAPLFAVAAFVLGGLVVFPVLVLIAATAAALGPWMGFFSAGAGVLLSALTLFAIGRALGQARLQRLLGRRAGRVQSRIIGKGVVAVAMIRMVPIAPFSIVNVVAGASKLSLRDFMLGTVLGMAPGIAVMAALGAQIADLARNASWSNALLLALAILAWIALCLGVQFLVTWWAGRRT